MDTYDVRRLALVLAVQAEIEGMKAYNQQAGVLGDSIGYNQSHFDQKAEELRNLAATHNDKLYRL